MIARRVVPALLALVLASPAAAKDVPSVVVLGIDGMDPVLLQQFVAQGRMPHFERLMKEGSF
jgi:hypothetical protein